jgi:hypothetical protein
MMKSTLFTVALTLSLAISSASAFSPAKFGQSTVADPLSQTCPCVIYFMGRYYCTQCW